ncbi:hypothetical protein PMAYCL1PPCAC_19229 [Pristionchus mayeri]|uniref:Uncharacterized protein n=1 Tax=Pristionchus mayeri TaxID=1317129 RepID=A0AAN5I296_9BILA|nr:hypothetical protein PMAYCL1PPCAC_19229 [Pristionchus mayeri]
MLPSTDALGNPIAPARPSRQLRASDVPATPPAPCTCASCPTHGSTARFSAPLGSAPSGHAPFASSSSSLPPFVAILGLLDELTTTTTAPNGDQERRIGGVRVSTVRDTAICAVCAVGCYRMFLCCCWPVHKCATILSCFDTLIVFVFFYNVLTAMMKGSTMANSQYSFFCSDPYHIVALLFCTAFLVCQLIGTIFICMAPKKKIAHYCWPRLVLITGLLICATIALVVMGIYFSGQRATMTNAMFSVVDFFYEDPLTPKERQEMSKDLKWYAGVLFALLIVFVIYLLFELLLLKKMYNELKKSEFHPVATQEPTAPPAFNPEFGGGKA